MDATNATTNEQLARLEKQHNGGAAWFFWIAGLSLLNSIIHATGSDLTFAIGLGLGNAIDFIGRGVAEKVGGAAYGVTLLFNVGLAALFVAIGVLARGRRPAAYIVGMLLYVGDALILVLVQDWFSLAFHGVALFFIFGGLTACRTLRQLDRQAALQQGAPVTA